MLGFLLQSGLEGIDPVFWGVCLAWELARWSEQRQRWALQGASPLPPRWHPAAASMAPAVMAVFHRRRGVCAHGDQADERLS